MNTNRKRHPLNTLLGALALVMAISSQAYADPLPGRDEPKFTQLPMISTTIPGPNGTVGIYHGHDELSTLYNSAPLGQPFTQYSGIAMADDFADEFSSPVLHVKWWGSYMFNSLNQNNAINKFLIAFESDVPANQNPAGNFSTPGQVLNSQIVKLGALAPGSGTFSETRVLDLPAPGEDIYEYNAELHLGKEFHQLPETVYWLKIAALVDTVPGTTPVQWGWHNRDYTIMDPLAAAVTPPVLPGERDERIELGATYPTPVWHFQDDSVSAQTRVTVDSMMPNMPTFVDQVNYIPQHYVDGLDGPGPIVLTDGTIVQDGIGRFSKDLAFELYTYPIVPEPSSCLLIALGMVGFVARRR